MKTITVFTPAYNRAYCLDQCYQSLLRQTNKEFIWLIIDDGSTDNTKELITEINLKHSNVHLFERTSLPSLPMSIWDGIERSKSEYVLWMDADGSMPAETVKEEKSE